MIYVFSPAGEVIDTHPVPCRRPTNCAFGGGDLTTLYVTTIEGFLFRTRTNWAGRATERPI
jgi:gluconolactonase